MIDLETTEVEGVTSDNNFEKEQNNDDQTVPSGDNFQNGQPSFGVEKTAMIFGQSEEDIGKEYKEYKAFKLFRRVDADLTSAKDSENLKLKINEAIKFGFGNVIVNPRQIKEAKKLILKNPIGVYGAVCYPYGEELYGVKKVAVRKTFQEGADGVYLPVGTSDVKRGKYENVKKEFTVIARRYRHKKIFAVLEVAELDYMQVERVVKILLKANVAGIVSGSGHEIINRTFSGASDLHSLSGGKRTVVAYSGSEKSKDVVSLFSVADRVFLKNAPKIAMDLKANLEI